MAERAKRSESDIRREVAQRLQEIELLREEARQRGLAFSSPSEEELTEKAGRLTSQSPYIYSMSWTSGTTPGSTAYFNVYYSNPDPAGYYPVFATIFFGFANSVPDIAQGWAGRDVRWPAISSPPSSLASGATGSQAFSYVTPTNIPSGTYLGNAILWRGQFHDQGTYFDRGGFYVTLT